MDIVRRSHFPSVGDDRLEPGDAVCGDAAVAAAEHPVARGHDAGVQQSRGEPGEGSPAGHVLRHGAHELRQVRHRVC